MLTRRLLAVPAMKAYFLEELSRCIDLAGGPEGWLEQQIETQYRQIQRAAADDTNKPYPYADFDAGVGYLEQFAFERGQTAGHEMADSASETSGE